MPQARQPRPPALRRATITSLMAMLALTASGAAFAQANPYYIGATLGYAHDSNVYRTTLDPKSDSYTSIGLVAGLDQPIGRQRVYANGNVRNNRYSKIDNDNVSYGLNAGLDWSTIERLSGSVNLSLNQSLATYGVGIPGNQQITLKNLERNRLLSARAQWGLVSLLTLEGTVTHRETSYSADASKPNDLDQDSVSVGLKYRPSGALTLGTALRFTRGSQPGQDFDRRDIDFTANWFATGQSTVNARLSVTQQDFDAGNTGRDISGATGLVAWIYRPTAKLRFATTLSRDTGAESSFYNLLNGQTDGIGDSSRYTNALALTASYEVTAKIRATVAGRYARRSLDNSAGDSGNDATKSLSLSISYEPTRNWLLSCNAARNTRGASQEAIAANLTYRYGSDSYGCTAQFTIQ